MSWDLRTLNEPGCTPVITRYRKWHLIVLIIQKPQNGLTKRKGPTWCKNVRKQIFFRFRYLIMAKKIYHALMVVYLILYLRHHQEHCTHGRCQGDFSIVWVGHRSPAQGVSPFIPSSCVCPWRHCTALLEGAKTCPCTPAPAMQVCLLQL